MSKRISLCIIAIMMCCVNIITVINANAITIQNEAIVTNCVDEISGKYFYKNGYIYKHSNDSKKKIVKKKVKKFVAVDDSIVFLDNDNNLWVKGNAHCWFYYQKNTINEKNLRVAEKNVNKFWADEYGIAFIRDNTLYAYGELEYIRNDEFLDEVYPPFLVEYTGVEAEKIEDVTFNMHRMFIVMKNGRVYTCWPKQKEIKNGTLVTSFEKTRNICEDNLLTQSNIKKYTDHYIIKKNGDAKLLIQKYDDGPEQYFCLKKVKRCMVTKNMCFWLKKNGRLYCGKKKGLKVVKKKLIAKKVKRFSKSNGGVYYLTKERKLYFVRITKK